MNNIEILSSGGLKCDAPGCGWMEAGIPVTDYEKYINAPCPLCGANVLTEEDYQNVKTLMAYVELMNSIPKDKIDALADALGLPEQNPEPNKIFTVETHKEIRITNIRDEA